MKKYLSALFSLSLCILLTDCGGSSSTPANTNSAAITVSPSPLSFVVNGSGDITVTNSGSIPLTNLTATPASTGHLTVSSTTCTNSIAAGGTCTYVLADNTVETTSIVFSGSDSQNHELSLSLSVTITSSGTGAISASPNPLTLTTGQNGTLTITNTGTDTITGFSAILGGSLSQVSTTCSARISVNASCTYTLLDNTAEITSIGLSATGVSSVTVPVHVNTANTAIISESTTALSGTATVLTSTVTLTNIGNITAQGLTYTPSTTLTNYQAVTTCSTTLAPGAYCTYAIYTTERGTVTLNIAGNNLSATPTPITFTINPVAATIVEDAAADVSGSPATSTFLNTAAKAALNMVFVDNGYVNAGQSGFSNTCPVPNPPVFFQYLAPPATINHVPHNCQNFSALVTAYSPRAVVPWVSGANLDSESPSQLITDADTVANAINNDPGAAGVAIEADTVFDTNTTGQSNFMDELSSILKTAHKTLYIYEPKSDPQTGSPYLNLPTLENNGNVVILIGLYDLNNTFTQTNTFSSYNTLSASVINGIVLNPNKYGTLPYIFMPPAAGTDQNWQTYIEYQTGYDPYSGAPPTGISNPTCDTTTYPDCILEYQNDYTGYPTEPSGYSPQYPQMFGYTQTALCNISANTTVFDNTRYSGVLLYNVHPAGFWQNTGKYGTFPEFPEDASWNLLAAWSIHSSICP